MVWADEAYFYLDHLFATLLPNLLGFGFLIVVLDLVSLCRNGQYTEVSIAVAHQYFSEKVVVGCVGDFPVGLIKLLELKGSQGSLLFLHQVGIVL